MASTSTAARIAVVHVDDPRGRWSVSAAQVTRIVTADEWQSSRGEAAVDVLASLGALPASRNRRVLVVRGAGGAELALVAAGAVEIAEIERASVLPLPSLLATDVPQICAVIVASDDSLSLLIEPSAVISGDTVVGEDLCPSHS